MKLSILDSAKVIYEARRAVTNEFAAASEEATNEVAFEQLTSAEREPLLAEVQENRQSGTPMNDALGRAIEDALR